jgi:hypothetical protein
MKYNICILLLNHISTTLIFTLIKSYCINTDRGGGNVESYRCSICYLNKTFVTGDVDNEDVDLRGI